MRLHHALPVFMVALLGCRDRPPRPVAAALPFIEDDYARALAQARARKLPLFVDVWAPW